MPVLGIAAFIPSLCTGAGIKIPGASFITPYTPPLSYMGPAAAIWMGLGVIYLVYLYLTNPQRVAQVGLVHVND